MYFLGAMVVWAPMLAIAGAIVATMLRIIWGAYQRIRRARRADWWASQQPYDRARVRALEAYAWERGWADGLSELP